MFCIITFFVSCIHVLVRAVRRVEFGARVLGVFHLELSPRFQGHHGESVGRTGLHVYVDSVHKIHTVFIMYRMCGICELQCTHLGSVPDSGGLFSFSLWLIEIVALAMAKYACCYIKKIQNEIPKGLKQLDKEWTNTVP